MDQNDLNEQALDEEKAARLERLVQRGRKSDHSSIHGYSKFVRLMRLVLLLSALSLVAVLYLRSGLEEQVIKPMEEVIKAPRLRDHSIARNELLNPKFESTSKQNFPYEITAQRAVQGEMNKNLIILERPVGRITMEDGMHVVLQSVAGAYRQDTGRFFLEGDVYFEHNGGYTLHMQEAHIDLKKGFAWSEKDIAGQGPDMKIAARGVRVNNKTGEVFFTGPATLTLDRGVGGL
ncbi:MAG: LPS export ABC transporter periplasmic protein LptC [Alphaproteobacteria bacterium]|nr:LPS export ABC transporter periplasmic protein LptC [Alphaproteobacteria bacterium]